MYFDESQLGFDFVFPKKKKKKKMTKWIVKATILYTDPKTKMFSPLKWISYLFNCYHNSNIPVQRDCELHDFGTVPIF